MNTVPAAIKAAHEPQVNLLPPEVEARRAQGRQRGLIGMAFFAFLVLLGFGVFWATSQESAAKAELQAALNRGAELQAEIDTYQPVLDIQSELKGAQDALTFVGSVDVTTFDFLQTIIFSMPSGVGIEGISWTVSSVAALAPQETGPFAVPDVGMISLNGTMESFINGVALEESLNNVPGLARARIVTEELQDSEGGQYYAFQGTVRVTALAFTGRFSPSWLENQALLDAADALDTRVAEAEEGTMEELLANYDRDGFLDFGRLVEEAKSEVAALTADIAELTADIAELTADIAELTADIDDLKADVAGFTVAVDKKEVGAAENLAKAKDDLATAQDDLATAQDDLATAQDDLVKANENLVKAQERLNPLLPILGTLVKAINAWDEDEGSLSTVEKRIAAAEEYVANAQTGFDKAQAAVFAGDEGAWEALDAAQARLSRAEEVLAEEQSYLEAAQDAESFSRADLDAALAAAAAAVANPDGDVVGEGS